MKQTFAATAAILIGTIDVCTKVVSVNAAARNPSASAYEISASEPFPPCKPALQHVRKCPPIHLLKASPKWGNRNRLVALGCCSEDLCSMKYSGWSQRAQPSKTGLSYGFTECGVVNKSSLLGRGFTPAQERPRGAKQEVRFRASRPRSARVATAAIDETGLSDGHGREAAATCSGRKRPNCFRASGATKRTEFGVSALLSVR